MSNYLMHYGVRGMKWGVRKTRTPVSNAYRGQNTSKSQLDAEAARAQRRAKAKKAVKIGAAVAVTAVAAYGAYKYGPKLAGKIAKGQAAVHNRKTDPFADYKLERKTEVLNRMQALGSDAKARSEASRKEVEVAKKIAADTAKTSKKLSDFSFERAYRMRPDGTTHAIDLPVDKKGYADAFAKEMSKNSSRKSEDYEYWYKYITNRMR